MPGRPGTRGTLLAGLVATALVTGCVTRGEPTPLATPLTTSASPTSVPPATPRPTSSPVLDVPGLFRQVSPSVLFVGTPVGTGSGIVIDERHVLTNAHVVRPFGEARLVDSRGAELGTATVVGWDLLADLAVLEAAQPFDAPTIAVGRPSSVGAGETVYLVGYPDADPAAPVARITSGIVTGRPLEWRDDLSYLETDAAMGSGQSGGALVDAAGRLLGISGGTRGSIAVSLDARDALDIVGRLLAGEDVDGLGDRLIQPAPTDAPRRRRARIRNRADVHAWVVSGHQGDARATIDVTAGGNVGLYALAAAGGLASGGGPPGRSLTVTLDYGPPGPYLVKVEPFADAAIDVTLRATVGLTPLVDPDDGPELRVGDRYVGVADYAGDIDWFTVRLAKGDGVLVSASGAGFDPALFIDAVETGRTIAAGRDAGGPLGMDDVVRIDSPKAGVYRIVVSDRRFIGFGGYRLEIARA